MSDRIPLFAGKVKAKRIGSFVREGFDFDVVRPGVDIQGRNRKTWTQIVWGGYPVWEFKKDASLVPVIERFALLWDACFKDKPDLARKVMQAEIDDRVRHFQDGVKGELIAPASMDGPEDGTRYPG